MFFNDAGEPLRMVGFTSDVTRRKSIEEELRRSAAFLAQAQQLSRTGSFSWRVATDEITWSEELYRIYEFDPGTTITLKVIRARVHPEDLTLYEKMVEQARNGADDFEWQYRLLMPDARSSTCMQLASDSGSGANWSTSRQFEMSPPAGCRTKLWIEQGQNSRAWPGS
jgi:PAS domain-containing protein